MTFHPRQLTLVVVAVLMFAAGLVRAQQGRGAFPAAQRVSQILDRMTQSVKDVGASEEQHKTIDPILADARQRFSKLVQDLIPEQPVVRRQRLADFLTDTQAKIDAALTEDQVRSFAEKVGDFRQELLGNLAARGNAAPASQPAMGQETLPPRLGVVVERLRDYLNQVDLTDAQKGEVDTLFGNARKKLAEIQQSTADADAQRQQEQQIVQDLRQELGAILSPPQLERLRTAVSQGNPAGGRRGQPDMPMMQPPEAAIAATPPAPAEPEIPLLDVGQAAPDFSLKRLDGAVSQLSTMKGRPVLIVFGSYSSPSFRQRAASLDKINRDYASRIVTLVIYTRENHPVGDWNVDRNKDDKISVEQPADMNGRLAIARQARTGLKINVPFLMDTIDDATAKTYSGLTNSAYLIARDGTIAARQKWFEPYAMRADIEDLLKPTAPPKAGE